MRCFRFTVVSHCAVSTVCLAALVPACGFTAGGGRSREQGQALLSDSSVFINEIHYDNAGVDEGEAIEIAGPAGTELGGYEVVLYNGNGGEPYASIALDGSLPDLGGGFGVLDFEHSGIQNGSPDGLALVDPSGLVLQFLSYEGGFGAVGGPADGLSSTDIGASESGSGPVGDSLQLVGTGTRYEDFAWAASSTNTFGAINLGQQLGNPGDRAPALVSTAPADGDFQVATDANLGFSFSEPVTLAEGAVALECNGSPKGFDISGGAMEFTLTPSDSFAPGDVCTVSITGSLVADQDSLDPPDTLASDRSWHFYVPRPLDIAEVQGAAHISPFDGDYVVLTGVVTALEGSGFYLQSESPDCDEATSEGIFVYVGGPPLVQPGDAVSVTGPVAEFRPGCSGCDSGSSAFSNLTLTEISAPNQVTIISSGNPLPEPVVIGQGGRKPPRKVIDDDTHGSVELDAETTFDPKRDGIDFYEALEGMRVRVNDAVAVSPTSGFGEIAVVGDGGARASRRTARGGLVVRKHDFNPERILVDDTIVFSEPQVDVGARFVQPIVGVMSYSFGNFKLNNTEPLAVEGATSLAREVFGAGQPGACQLDLATFNVENLSPADSAAKFDALASIVVNHLSSPDILTLEEVQDNSGPSNDGVVDASETLSSLSQAIRAAGGPAYEYAEIAPEDGQDGGQPGGNIRVAFLYNPARGVTLVDRPGATATSADQVVGSHSAELLYSPGRIDPTNPVFEDSRKPLVAQFEFRGRSLFVIANHWNSKGGDQPLFGRFQPPTMGSEVQRLGQARAVADFVRQITAADKRARVVVMGDLNDFEFSAPVGMLEAAGLKDLLRSLNRSERYTYVYDGNSQALDHILLSRGARVRGYFYDIVHVNAEFHDQVSDHDPSVVRLTLD